MLYFTADGMKDIIDENTLEHVGTPHEGDIPHSGRYAYGSGETPYQRLCNFKATQQKLKAEGLTEAQIAKAMGFKSVAEYKTKNGNVSDELRRYQIQYALKYSEPDPETGKPKHTTVWIANKLGVTEGTVRNWLKNPEVNKRSALNQKTADQLKAQVERDGLVDVSKGAELYLGVSSSRLKGALDLLENDGYKVDTVWVKQLTTGKDTTTLVLHKDDISYADVNARKYEIAPAGITTVTDIDGEKLFSMGEVNNVSSKRVGVRYAEEGGLERDGMVFIKRGVNDISLGNQNYAQVRIGVHDEDTGQDLYIKGMAVYADDKEFPPGCDILVNSNKKVGTPMYDPETKKGWLKPQKSGITDTNPFGASIKDEEHLKVAQKYYVDENGNKQLSPINIVRESGDWAEWQKRMASQFLSKQPEKLAKQQLQLKIKQTQADFEDIMALENNTVKKKMLADFAEQCDKNAAELKAAPFAGQRTAVILSFPNIKDNEVYAPNYPDGTKVVLVRYPHEGRFELPELTVNNKYRTAKSIIGQSEDAIGINPHTAEQLSGADFDGDTAVIIPNSDKLGIVAEKQLKGLQGFNNKEAYPEREGMKYMTKQQTQQEMGKISNLIADMTIQGATEEELTRATKHSMVVIDAEKHKLDYKRSEKENQIQALKDKYQPKDDLTKKGGGPHTIVTAAGSEVRVPELKDVTTLSPYRYNEELGKWVGNVDTKTGELIRKVTGNRAKYYERDEEGNIVLSPEGKKVIKEGEYRTTKVDRMYTVKDAYELTSGGSKDNPGTKIEAIYAEYANQMKSMANNARLAYINTPNPSINPDAKREYKEEVQELVAQLNNALRNAPKERQAQRIAHIRYDAALQKNTDLDKEHMKKLRNRCLQVARECVGANKPKIVISDRQWEAIQAGAISHSQLTAILNNADSEQVKKLATPKDNHTSVTSTKASAIKAMARQGYTQAEIAERFGISTSTVNNVING